MADDMAAAAALTDAVDFEGGTLIEGALPAAGDDAIVITPLEATVIVSPGDTDVIMALDVRNDDEDADPVVATLVEFGTAGRHIDIDAQGRSTRVEAQVRIENSFGVEANVCDELCNRTYALDVTETTRLASGTVGSHATMTLQLDCRQTGRADRCEAGAETNVPDTVAGDGDGDGDGAVGADCVPNPDTANTGCTFICPEICNGVDDDCDGAADEAAEADAYCVSRIVNTVTFCDDVKGECVPVKCNDGFLQCDGDPDNGCEPECDCMPCGGDTDGGI